MSESQKHIDLVNIALDHAKSIVPSNYIHFVSCDAPGFEHPCAINGNFIPDVLYRYKNLLIIGEAKTHHDFERKHSKEQFEAYMRECALFDGDSIMIIAVPWEIICTAKNYFRRLKNKQNKEIKIIIINEIGGCFVI